MNLTNLNFESLTVAEGRELEKAAGMSIGKVFQKLQGEDYSMDLLAALLLVVGRRENPGLTMEEIDAVDLSSLSAIPPPKAAKGHS